MGALRLRTPHLPLLFALILPIGGLYSQNQKASLADAERSFRDQVLKDDTLTDKRLFMRRYELVLKLLKKERWADASRELGEIREDFAGRSAAFLDYLRARIEMKRGDDLHSNALQAWDWATTNVLSRPDQRYLWFPEKKPEGETRLVVEQKSMPYPLAAKEHYDLSETLLTRLTVNPSPVLREAAALALGDLAYSRGEPERAAELWGDFTRKFPASALRLDAWLRLSRAAVARGAFADASALLRQLQGDFPRSASAGLVEEKIQLLGALAGSVSPTNEIRVILEGYRRELALQADLSRILDQLAARGLAEP